jgi:hypothetical protein
VGRFLIREPSGQAWEETAIVVMGLTHPVVEAYETMVAWAAGVDAHALVLATEVRLSAHDRDCIQRAFAGTHRPKVAFIESLEDGQLRAQKANGCDEAAMAGALATFLASRSRAQQASVFVELDDVRHRVDLELVDGSWQCQVRD